MKPRFLWKLLKYLEPVVLWIWFFQTPKSGGCYKMQIPIENWLIPGQGWLMFFTTEERFVFCWCAWHGHKATQQRTKVYANFTTSKCILISQMLSLDFEWIHWSHWRGCSCDLVNSLVYWTTEPTFHFVIIFASHSYMEKLQNCAKDDFLNLFMGTFHDMTWESFHVNAAIIRAIQNYMRTHAASIWSACIKFLFPEQEDHPYVPDIIWKGLNFFQSRK